MVKKLSFLPKFGNKERREGGKGRRRKREKKGIQLRKKGIRLALFTNDIIASIEKSQEIYPKIFILFSKITGYKVSTKYIQIFQYTSNNQ